MPRFSTRSIARLTTCHRDLQELFAEVVKHWDCKVIWGHRGEAEQEEAFRAGNSTKRWPDSKHNQLPSLAVDVAPYPLDWEDTIRFYAFSGFVLGIAQGMGLNIRWGGDWDGDRDLHDQKLRDLVHFELIPEDDGRRAA